MFIKPAPGLKVRDPVRQDVLPEAGREVAPSVYWSRRLRDGDVEQATAPTPSAAAQAAPVAAPVAAPAATPAATTAAAPSAATSA